MNTKPSEHDTPMNEIETTEVSRMERKAAQELIQQLKAVKIEKELSYPRIMDRIEANGKSVSLTTLRRVFADSSEANAANFNYELTLMPIAEAILNPEDTPTPADNPSAKEIDALKAVIRCQNEEIARLHELKEHLDNRVDFLLEQIKKKDKRMDTKDEMIEKLMKIVFPEK